MNCIHCDRPAHGICILCGRALCRDHFQKEQRVLSLLPGKGEGSVRALVVDDAIRCNLCRPISELLDVQLSD